MIANSKFSVHIVSPEKYTVFSPGALKAKPIHMPKSPPKYDMTSSVPCFPSFLVIVIPLNGVSIPTILTSLNPWLFNIFLSESF